MKRAQLAVCTELELERILWFEFLLQITVILANFNSDFTDIVIPSVTDKKSVIVIYFEFIENIFCVNTRDNDFPIQVWLWDQNSCLWLQFYRDNFSVVWCTLNEGIFASHINLHFLTNKCVL